MRNKQKNAIQNITQNPVQKVKAKKFNIDKKHIQGFITGILVSAVVFAIFIAQFNPSVLTGSTYYISEKTVADIDTVYYLKSDTTILKIAGTMTKDIKFVPVSKQYGFENIDIIVEGSVGDRYTLVFGVGSDSDKMVLAGAPKMNSKVEWIKLDNISKEALREYGDLYTSNERGAWISVKKSGVKTFISSIIFAQAGGIIIDFTGIGKTDLYSVFIITLTGADGITKTFKILCHNIHIDVETGNDENLSR